jgi:hypothetical protein
MKLGKSFSSPNGLPPPIRPAGQSRPDFFSPRSRLSPGPTWPPRPRPTPRASSPPTRADAPDRVRLPASRGGRMPATPAGWRPVAPISTRTPRFKPAATPRPSHSPPFASAPPRAQQPQQHRSAAPSSPKTSVLAMPATSDHYTFTLVPPRPCAADLCLRSPW